MRRLFPRSNRLLPVHVGIFITFLLIPVWYRWPPQVSLPLLPPLYVSRFALLLPLLWTVLWWLALGLPGFGQLRRDPLRRVWALALLLLVAWAFASTTWAFRRVENPEVGATAALQLGIAVLFVVVVACACPPRRVLVLALVIGLVWNSALAVLQVAGQGSVGLLALGEFPLDVDSAGVSIVQAEGVRRLRPYGLLPHPNMLAGFLTVGLLAAGAWVFSRRLVLWWLGTAVSLFGLWALGLTFSRAAWGGLLAGALVTLPLLWRARRRERDAWLLAGVTLVLALVIGLVFFFVHRPFLLARAGVTTEAIELRSISDRVVYMDFALRAVGEFPVQGVGIGNFPWRASYYLLSTDFALRGDNAHNIYLAAWAELGTVGLALLAVALVSGAWAAWRGLWRSGDVAGSVLLGGFVALAAVGLLDHYPWTILHFQVAFWGLLAAAGFTNRQDAEEVGTRNGASENIVMRV